MASYFFTSYSVRTRISTQRCIGNLQTILFTALSVRDDGRGSLQHDFMGCASLKKDEEKQ